MTNEEMKKELNENNIKDNPFDVIMYHSLELARDALFACARLKNPNIPQFLKNYPESFNNRFNILINEIEKFENLSDDTISMCRDTCYFNDPYNHDIVNTMLIGIENKLETEWSRIRPNRNDRYEKIRLGKDSPEYKRLLELRSIAHILNIDKDYYSSLIDIIDNDTQCIEYGWMDEDEYKERKDLIKKYNFTTDDIRYIISYKYER